MLIAFAYSGAPFFGVAPQPGLPTAGGALLDRLEGACGRRPRALAITARTDAGVHADVALATCHLPSTVPFEAVEGARHPRRDGLTQVCLARVPPTVHARGLAVAKRYVYRVRDGRTVAQARAAEVRLGPHGRSSHWHTAEARAWQVAGRLDVAAMRVAARHLRGTRDFRALRGRRGRRTSPVKTVRRLVVRRGPAGVRIRVEGDAFLRHQVRRMAALLVEVGLARRSPHDLARVLAWGDVREGAWPAPARGLTLAGLQPAGAPAPLTTPEGLLEAVRNGLNSSGKAAPAVGGPVERR